MRVLLLNQFYRPDTAATGQLLADVGAALARGGHEVHVIASRGAYGGGTQRFPAECVQDGVAVHRVAATGFGRAGLLGRAVDYASFYLLAWRRAMQLPPMDAALCLTTPPMISLVGSALKHRRGTRLIYWPMDLYPEIMVALGMLGADSLPERILRRVSRYLYRRADAVIALGEVMARAERQAGARETTVVHNWVPGERVEPTDPPRRDEVVWMYSGNLGWGHELETAVAAMAQLRDRRALRLRIIGQGKMAASLQRQVDEADLESVSFGSPCPLEKLSEQLAEGDVHLVSQRPGTQGLLVPSKVYGILAAARPAIYIGPEDTEVAAILRDSGAGIICPPGDVKAVAEAAASLAGDPARREAMGRAGRAWYDANGGRARSVERIVDIIQRRA